MKLFEWDTRGLCYLLFSNFIHNDGRNYLNSCYVFLIYITLPFIQLVYFISSEKKLTIHIVQMFLLLSQVFYNLKMFLMMDMLGLGDAININTNKNIRQVC
ncbi:Uncharacterised protein [Escherichia coli]|nr:hypothetical protein ECMP0215612_2022 [Escherichia coli MP021561.2]ERB03784.1 hypothetical protein G878_01415 [Escherichia coli KOEGE 3 (4a)]CTU73094.1 Uncharacterised protein [Escherichia coli]CTY40002.1 Uncharacterised protein [Escherichia coli]SQJ87188.1 Uncharacterised protein [Escherichia coli]